MLAAGEFGFQKEMNALASLTDASKLEGGLSDVDVLLGATHEVESRLQGPLRVLQVWKRELWHGAYLLRRYRVRHCPRLLQLPNPHNFGRCRGRDWPWVPIESAFLQLSLLLFSARLTLSLELQISDQGGIW